MDVCPVDSLSGSREQEMVTIRVVESQGLWQLGDRLLRQEGDLLALRGGPVPCSLGPTCHL